ncbi:MAG TPA: hypothetical protein VGA03_09500 [Anaerolineales bacterium]|jgi:hypothetical protein
MEEALRFFRAYEIWIYGLLALGGLLYIRKFFLAWGDLRGAAFGLERESAQSRVNQSASMLVLLLAIAITEFVLVSYVAPTVPGATPLFTPTLDLLATATTTLPNATEGTETPPGEEALLSSPSPPEQASEEGCVPGQVNLTEPEDGTEVEGVVTLVGTADIENFGFYKYEVARPGETVWLTLQAGRDPIQESELGQWDTSTLAPGEYMLRLVVTDNAGQSLQPCVIQVRVSAAPQTP